MAIPNSPQTTVDVGELGRALATSNDWRAIVIVMTVVITLLMGIIFWDRFVLNRLHKSLDRLTAALWALKLQLARMDMPVDDEPDKSE